MDYKTFMDCVSNVKDFSLPGKQAHLRTMPKERKKQLENLSKEHPNAKYAAVLIYCYPKNGIMHMSLIKRTTYKGPHSGQISLPGGKPEAVDKSLWHTALRECKEELGVSLLGSKPLLNLSPIYIPPSNFLVSPFVVVYPSSPVFAPDPREVAQHIEIPLSELIQLKVKQSLLYEGVFKGTTVPSYIYEEHTIWGATAMILSEFKFFLEHCALI
jgi:8-oxo-dGTP pyrophosphatase MutT (NUDIX family)